MAKNKIKSGQQSLSWFTANAAIVLDAGQQVFVAGSASGVYKVGDGLTALSALNFSNYDLLNYQTTTNAVIANKQDKQLISTGVVPVSTGPYAFGDSLISYDGTTTTTASPNGLANVSISNSYSTIRHDAASGPRYSAIEVYEDHVIIAHEDAAGTQTGQVSLYDAYGYIQHSTQVKIDTPSVLLNQLTASRAIYLNASKVLVSSTTTSGADIDNIAGLTSNAQAQFNAINAVISSSISGILVYCGSFTPSGSYPSTGGTGTSGAIKKGNSFVVTGLGVNVAGTVGGRTVYDRDLIIAETDSPGNTDSNWAIQAFERGYIPLTQSLATGYVFVGNGSGIATAVQYTPIGSGGTGTGTASPAGSVFIADATGVHTNDFANFNYSSVTKTLNINNISVTPSIGTTGVIISSTDANSIGLSINTAGGGFEVANSNAAKIGGYIYSAGVGLVVSSADVAGNFNSNLGAAIFNQSGVLAASNSAETILISRAYTSPGSFVASGPIINVVDSNTTSVSTGNRIQFSQNGSNQFVVDNRGFVSYGNVSGTIPYMVTLDGTADRFVGLSRNTVSNTGGKAIYFMGGGATVGSTDKNGGTAIISPGIGTGAGNGGIQFWGFLGVTSGTTDIMPAELARMNGDGRWGIGTTNPLGKFHINGNLYVQDGTAQPNYIATAVDTNGQMVWANPSSYTLPAATYSTTTTASTDTTIIASSIPALTFRSDGDKTVYDFVIGNAGGTAASVVYKVTLGGNALNSNVTLPLNASSDSVTLRITLRRVGTNRIYYTLQYNFGSHYNSTISSNYWTNDTTNAYDFTSAIALNVIGNEVATNRHIAGVFGNGTYYKFS